MSCVPKKKCCFNDCEFQDGCRDIEVAQNIGALVGYNHCGVASLDEWWDPLEAYSSADAECASSSHSRKVQQPKPKGYDFNLKLEFGPENKEMPLRLDCDESLEVIVERFLEQNNLAPNQKTVAESKIKKLLAWKLTTSSKDFVESIQVRDGRQLSIVWNRGDDPEAIAQVFAEFHGDIPDDEMPSIVQYIRERTSRIIQL